MGGVHICEILQNGFWAGLIYKQPVPFIQVYCFNKLCTLNTTPSRDKNPIASSSCLGTPVIWTPSFPGWVMLEVDPFSVN